MISRLFDSGAIPALDRMLQFTTERQKYIAHNIANLSTPQFKPVDLSVDAFHKELASAIQRRHRKFGGPSGPLEMHDTRELRFTKTGLQGRPRELNENILFHDQNNRDLEKTMQKLAENALVHQATVDLLKNEYDMLQSAIQERA